MELKFGTHAYGTRVMRAANFQVDGMTIDLLSIRNQYFFVSCEKFKFVHVYWCIFNGEAEYDDLNELWLLVCNSVNQREKASVLGRKNQHVLIVL